MPCHRILRDSIEEGDFTLVVAVDSLSDELRRTIEYLNRHPKTATTICAAEVGYFAGEDHEVVAPRMVGPQQTEKGPGGTGAKWDETSYFAAAAGRCSAQAMDIMRRLYEFTKRESDNCKWGRGKDGSFTFRLERAGITGSIFSCFTSGDISLNFGYMDGKVAQDAVDRFADAVGQLEGFTDVRTRLQTKRWVHYKVDEVFAVPGNLETFERAAVAVRDSLGG
jgi:hypothetical protein